MCGDHFSRTPTIDSGDLVAIIHPSSQQRSVFSGGRLHLSNRIPGSTVSTLDYSRHNGTSCSISSQSSSASSSPSSPSFFDSYDDNNTNSPLSSSPAPAPHLLSVRIHKFGQPLLSVNAAECANPVLHSFAISSCAGGTGECESCLVGRRLNLSVGGDGVVGRTVSLVDERRQVVLGEGVIGWI